MIEHEGAPRYIPLRLRGFPQGIYALARGNKTMVPPKLRKMEIIPIKDLPKGILVQFPKVIGLSKGIVGQLPIQIPTNGRSPEIFLAPETVGCQLPCERLPKKGIHIKIAINLRVNPKEPIPFHRRKFNKAITGLVHGSKMRLVWNRKQLPRTCVAPVMKGAQKHVLLPARCRRDLNGPVPAGVEKGTKMAIAIAGGEDRCPKVF